jgi:hypothetical protein
VSVGHAEHNSQQMIAELPSALLLLPVLRRYNAFAVFPLPCLASSQNPLCIHTPTLAELTGTELCIPLHRLSLQGEV